MKKAVAIIVSVLFVVSVAGFAFAAEQKAAPTEKKEAKEAPAKIEDKAKAKMNTVKGEVAAVDAKVRTLTIKGKTGDVVVMSDDKTKFSKVKSLSDVKVGDKATVRYMEKDGKKIASSVITVAPPTKKAKAGKKEKAEMKEVKKEAVPTLADRSEKGDAEAQYLLGLEFSKADDKQDKVKAYMWLHAAVEQDYMRAVHPRWEISTTMTQDQIDEAKRLAAKYVPKKGDVASKK